MFLSQLRVFFFHQIFKSLFNRVAFVSISKYVYEFFIFCFRIGLLIVNVINMKFSFYCFWSSSNLTGVCFLNSKSFTVWFSFFYQLFCLSFLFFMIKASNCFKNFDHLINLLVLSIFIFLRKVLLNSLRDNLNEALE